MSRKVNAIKAAAVALGWASATTDMTSNNVSGVLKEIAVLLGTAQSVGEIRANSVAEVVQYIADNYGSEEKEPFNLAATGTHATIVVKRKGKTISPAADILYNGDVLTITATAAEGYALTALTVNGTAFESGSTFTVNGHNVTIAATGSALYDLTVTAGENTSVTVKSGDETVTPGENAIYAGQELTVTATAAEGYELSTFTVNGDSAESPAAVTVAADVTIVTAATAEQQ